MSSLAMPAPFCSHWRSITPECAATGEMRRNRTITLGVNASLLSGLNGNIDVVLALLAKGASVNKTDFTGRDAAGWAMESHRPAVVQAIKRAQTAKRS